MTPVAAIERPSPGRTPSVPAGEANAETLARDAQAGSWRSFASLVERFDRRIFAFLVRRTRNEADAEELTQETFLRAWQSLHRYDPNRPFATWLFTIASRLATDRHRGRVVAREQTMASDPEACRRRPLLGDDGRGALGNEAWIAAGEVLSERQHTAVWLRYVEDMAPADIARVLGVTGPACRIILFRARQAIARALEERGFDVHAYRGGVDRNGGDEA